MRASKAGNLLFCFVGPAGSGKTSIVKALSKKFDDLAISVSTTTRKKRANEEEGKHYYFVDKVEFERKIAAGDFIEHAVFNGNYYGTDKLRLEAIRQAGKDVLLDIEVQGVRQLKQDFGSALVTVFVFPPSFEVLSERLRSRGTESEEVIAERLAVAKEEIAILENPGFSDYKLINDELESAIEQAVAIIKTERTDCSHLER